MLLRGMLRGMLGMFATSVDLGLLPAYRIPHTAYRAFSAACGWTEKGGVDGKCRAHDDKRVVGGVRDLLTKECVF